MINCIGFLLPPPPPRNRLVLCTCCQLLVSPPLALIVLSIRPIMTSSCYFSFGPALTSSPISLSTLHYPFPLFFHYDRVRFQFVFSRFLPALSYTFSFTFVPIILSGSVELHTVPQRSNFCYFRFYSIFYIQCPGPVQSHIIAVLTTFLKSSFYP